MKTLCFALLMMLSACATTSVARTVYAPPTIPVLIHPQVFVTTLQVGDVHSDVLVRTLRDAIASRGDTRVEMVSIADLTQRHAAGQMRSTDAVLVVNQQSSHSMSVEQRQRSYQQCYMRTCTTRYDTYYVNVYHVRLDVSVDVRNAASGVVMQGWQTSISDYSYAGPGQAMMDAMPKATLAVSSLVLATPMRREIVFRKPDNEDARRAIELIAEDQWDEGRIIFESILASPSLTQAPLEERARIFYDAGLALVWSPGETQEVVVRVERGIALLQQALSMAASSERERALAAAQEYFDMLRRELLLQSERARLAAEAATAQTPIIPEGYLAPLPPVPPAPTAPAAPNNPP